MKLLRNELASGLKNELFEIPTEDLQISDIEFAASTYSCTLSSETALGGFKLTGTIELKTIETCDRCLSRYDQNHSIPVTLWLTADPELISEVNEDFIWFPEQQDSIDITDTIHDLVYLDEPLKRICSSGCKGLCPACGHNRNNGDCQCDTTDGDDRWNQLKQLIE